QIDSSYAGQFREDAGQHLATQRQAQRRELHGEPALVPIHRQSGEAVALAEDEAAGAAGHVQTEDVAAKPNRGFKAVAEERFVEWPISFPRVQTHTNLAAAVVESAGDEVARRRDEIHLIPVLRSAR